MIDMTKIKFEDDLDLEYQKAGHRFFEFSISKKNPDFAGVLEYFLVRGGNKLIKDFDQSKFMELFYLNAKDEEGEEFIYYRMRVRHQFQDLPKAIPKIDKLNECLDGMMASDMELYERILNTEGFAFHFNNLCNLAKE